MQKYLRTTFYDNLKNSCDNGTIFKIKADGTGYVKLLDLSATPNGSFPDGSLISVGSDLYGTADYGGINNIGTIFKYQITPTGIGEVNEVVDINICPTPFFSQTTVTFSEEQKNTTVNILDVLGKEIKTINFSGKELIIEKGEIQAGIYFVQIIEGNKNVVNRKIVVQ